MEQTLLTAVAIVLVCPILSLPYPADQISRTNGKSTTVRNINYNQDSRSTIKFPSHNKVPMSGHTVRVTQGTWSLGNKKNPSNNNRTNTHIDSESIIFPDQSRSKVTFKPKFATKTVPECAKKSTFCESVENYPVSYLASVLPTGAKTFSAMFGEDLVGDSLIHRIDSIEDSPLCPSVEQVVYPKTAKNKNDEWLFVVNQGEYTQGVRIERCLTDSESQSCMFTQGFPLGYKTYCKQKYIYRKLIALNSEGKPITDTFQLPSCCSCTVISEGLSTKIAGDASQKQKTIKPKERSKRNATR